MYNITIMKLNVREVNAATCRHFIYFIKLGQNFSSFVYPKIMYIPNKYGINEEARTYYLSRKETNLDKVFAIKLG